jgi:hypothetical protein
LDGEDGNEFEKEEVMKLRVRIRDLSIDLLLNTVVLPELPDWIIGLSDELPEIFRGKALVSVGSDEVVIGWDFSASLVADLLERLQRNEELDTVTTWGPLTVPVWLQGNEITAKGLIGIMVER